MASLWSTWDLLEYYINVTQTVWDISPLMPMHQDPLFVNLWLLKKPGVISCDLAFLWWRQCDRGGHDNDNTKHQSMSKWALTEARWLLVTHWGRDNMVTIYQTAFSNEFSSMGMYRFRLRFRWSLFPRVQLTIFPNMALVIEWCSWFRQYVQIIFTYWQLS